MVAAREPAALAEKPISQTCAKQQISPGQLAIRAGRGCSMTSRPVAFLLAGLGITQSIPVRTSPAATRSRSHSSRR